MEIDKTIYEFLTNPSKVQLYKNTPFTLALTANTFTKIPYTGLTSETIKATLNTDSITILEKGCYGVQYSFSYSSSVNNTDFEGSVFVNNEVLRTHRVCNNVDIGVITSYGTGKQAGIVYPTGSRGFLNLNVGDIVDFRVRCTSATTMTFERINLNIFRIV